MTTRAKELADRLRERFETNRADLLGLGYGPEIVKHLDRLAAIDSAAPGEVREIAERLAGVRALPWASQAEQYLSDIATLLAIIQRGAVALRQTIRDELLDAARAEVERLTALVDAFKAASMLDVGGDPDGVTPRLLERHVTALQNEVERLKEQDKRTVADGLAVLNKLTDARCEIERLKGELHDARTAELNALNAHESTIRRHSEFAQRHTSMEAQLVTELTAQTDKLRSERSSLAAENARLVSEHAAAMARADVLAEGVRLYWGDNGWNAAAALEWKRKHGHLVGDGK